MFTGRLLQVRSHEIRVAHWSTQGANALFVGGQPRSPPHGSMRVDHFCCPLQSCTNRRFHAELIPHVCLAHVDPNASMAMQVFLKTGVHCPCTVWLRRDVHIVKVSEQFLVQSQLPVSGFQS